MSCHRLGDFIKRLYGPRKPTNVPFQILSLDLSQKRKEKVTTTYADRDDCY